MRVFRICRSVYANDIEGTGAKLYGGRWNQVGVPCIYTSESRALATLEFAVNVSFDLLPMDLSLCTFEIKENAIQNFTFEDLPNDWRKLPLPQSTQIFGSQYFEKGATILRLPSMVIPDENNLLIHPENGKNSFKLFKVEPFSFDFRIKQ